MEDIYWFISAFILPPDGGVNLKLSTNFTTHLETYRVFFTATSCLQLQQERGLIISPPRESVGGDGVLADVTISS